MPVNRNALIRYKTLDNCLRNRYRLWTLEDLIDACSDALYEYEGIDKGVSRRTVQMDLQMMRSEKLGYNAPIVVKDRKYYSYEDPEYSITNIPLSNQDLNKLTEVVDILKQFKGFTHFKELSGMVQRLEDKVHVSKTKQRPVIDLEKNENLKGLEYIDPIFQAIVNKKSLEMTYQSFKARNASDFIFHPALLKEFRNRWFVLGKREKKDGFLLLALDRIERLKVHLELPNDFDEDRVKNYFKDVVGVSVNEGQEPTSVRLLVDHSAAPYVLTKPIHHSQEIIEKSDAGVEIALKVQINYELEREILGFGETIKVVSPPRLRSRIKEKLLHAIDIYDTDLNESRLKNVGKKLDGKGSVVMGHVFTRKSITRMSNIMHGYKSAHQADSKKVFSVRNLLNEVPDLKGMLFNKNLRSILHSIDPEYFLTKAIYFDKPADNNWYVTWHQDAVINVDRKKEVKGFKGWTKKGENFGVKPTEDLLLNTTTVRVHLDDTDEKNGALNVLPGSHQKILTDKEIQLITDHSYPQTIEVMSGGVHLMKPLTLHASSKSINNKKRRVIHLEFNSLELPGGLQWAERYEFKHLGE